MNKIIPKVENNKDKQKTYAMYMVRYKKAVKSEFYMEAIMIDYAMMEDRLVAFLHHLGIVTRTHEKLTVNKFCRADMRKLLGYKDNVGIKVENISVKVAMLESLMQVNDSGNSLFINAILAHVDTCADRSEILSFCEDVVAWCKIRNQCVHALLNKKYDALSDGLEEYAEHGYMIARRIDDCVKMIKKNNTIRRKFKIQ